MENFLGGRGLRSAYSSQDMDAVFCFFMRTYIRMQKNGRTRIPMDVRFERDESGAALAYLRTAVSLMEDAQPPEILCLVLETELYAALRSPELTREQISLLVMIRHAALWIYEGDLTSFLDTENLWGGDADEYANKTFYWHLPDELQKREGLDLILSRLRKNAPAGFLRPDDY